MVVNPRHASPGAMPGQSWAQGWNACIDGDAFDPGMHEDWRLGFTECRRLEAKRYPNQRFNQG